MTVTVTNLQAITTGIVNEFVKVMQQFSKIRLRSKRYTNTKDAQLILCKEMSELSTNVTYILED